MEDEQEQNRFEGGEAGGEQAHGGLRAATAAGRGRPAAKRSAATRRYTAGATAGEVAEVVAVPQAEVARTETSAAPAAEESTFGWKPNR